MTGKLTKAQMNMLAEIQQCGWIIIGWRNQTARCLFDRALVDREYRPTETGRSFYKLSLTDAGRQALKQGE